MGEDDNYKSTDFIGIGFVLSNVYQQSTHPTGERKKESGNRMKCYGEGDYVFIGNIIYRDMAAT